MFRTDTLRMPWQARCRRIDGSTHIWPVSHIEPSVTLDGKDYWPEGAEPTQDDYGYFVPDADADISDSYVQKAWLIVAAPAMALAWEAVPTEVRRAVLDELPDWVRASFAALEAVADGGWKGIPDDDATASAAAGSTRVPPGIYGGPSG